MPQERRLLPEDEQATPTMTERQLLMIVVGSSLRAEEADRPMAYRLQRRIEGWIKKHDQCLGVDIKPTLCTDLWYLNHADLQKQPTICLGGPGVNALSSYFAQHLPAGQREERHPRVLIQIDPDYTDLRVCLWGTNHELTLKGMQLFMRRYLDGFLRAVATQVEPSAE